MWDISVPTILKFKYDNWGDLQNKLVKPISNTKLISNFIVVEFVEPPNTQFMIPKLCLHYHKNNDIKCRCDIKSLFIRGCTCGAFKAEKKS